MWGLFKMTKEKPLSEKVEFMPVGAELKGAVFFKHDVALAVKRFKAELDDEHVNYWVDEIFGEFK